MKKTTSLLLTLLILTLAVLSISLFSSTSLAGTGTVSINVNVSEVSQISVLPSYLEWIQVVPGNNKTDQTITVTNVGSTVLTNGVYGEVNSFAEITNPWTGGTPRAGSFLVIKNSTSSLYYFVNRLEWNDTSIAGSVENKDANGVTWGFFRNKTQKWLWEVDKDNNGECLNSTAGVGNTAMIRIKTTAFDGTYNLATNMANGSSVGANTTEYSFWTFASGPLYDYCVALRKTCDAFMIYKWDKNSSWTACGSTLYLNNTLQLTGSLTLTANVFVPSGTQSGNATASILTITAT